MKTTAGSNLNNVMLLSLNTEACNSYNLGNMDQKQDVAGQLAWLEQRLILAKSLGMQVFIIGHIPPGNIQCNDQWSRRYHILIERYQDIVTLQAYGSEGTDSFRV